MSEENKDLNLEDTYKNIVESQENTEDDKEDNPNVFGNNSPDGDDLDNLRMSSEDEYDVPSFMRKKN